MMKNNELLKKVSQQLLVIVGFIILSYLYFYPVLTGKKIVQSDMLQVKGVTHELFEYKQQNPGEDPLWTNSMFGGMPSYLVVGGKTFNIFYYVKKIITLGMPGDSVAILFLLLVGFYFLMQVLRFNKIISVAGAISYALASYNIIIISAGHITKAYALAFVPAVIAGVLLLFDKKYLVGLLVTAFSTGMLISCSHHQISYYTFLILLVLFIVKLIFAIKEKEIKHYIITTFLAIFSAGLAILPISVNLLPVSEYSKYSIRGPSELKKSKSEITSTTGLDKDYAFQWSYGIGETFSVLVPNLMGAGVNGFKSNSETAKQLENIGIRDAEKIASSMPVYWGRLPFTVGPAYFGAIICFLFVLGLFVVRGAAKWWLLFVAILSFVLSWGKNFSLVSDFFFYHFPLYNKFRTVDMILVMANFAFPFLGFLGLKAIILNDISKEEVLKSLKYSFIIVGGLLLVFILIPGWFFNFTSLNDAQLIEQLKAAKWPNDLIENLMAAMRDDRKSILQTDALRSLFFVGIAFALLWFYVKKQFNIKYLTIPLVFLILIDLWTVDRRYLNSDSFVSKTYLENNFVPSEADNYILKDNDPDYRVLNLARNVFNDGFTSYFHKSIGGYHAAKLRRYQDMIDGPLSADIGRLQNMLQQRMPIDFVFMNLPILNMLNCKYVIYNPDSPPLLNNYRLGNAWFVKEIKWVNTPDEEYEAVSDSFNPRNTAIIDKKWENNMIDYVGFSFDSIATIKLISYKPHELIYESSSKSKQVAVFSEIFYEKGWNAYIDGKLVPHGRANYILRTMVVPAGNHKIKFKFEPKVYTQSQNIAKIGSLIIILLIIIVIVIEVKESYKKDELNS